MSIHTVFCLAPEKRRRSNHRPSSFATNAVTLIAAIRGFRQGGTYGQYTGPDRVHELHASYVANAMNSVSLITYQDRTSEQKKNVVVEIALIASMLG